MTKAELEAEILSLRRSIRTYRGNYTKLKARTDLLVEGQVILYEEISQLRDRMAEETKQAFANGRSARKMENPDD